MVGSLYARDQRIETTLAVVLAGRSGDRMTG
jgi:hypothetical protein